MWNLIPLILGAVLVSAIIAFLVCHWCEEDVLERGVVASLLSSLLFLIAFIIVGFTLENEHYEVQTAELDAWAIDAPFGTYWVESDGEGGGSFIGWRFESHSRLQESYTIKYLEGNELKTIIVTSVDDSCHIIFHDDNRTDVIVERNDIYRHRDNWLTCHRVKYMGSEYFIYLPEPTNMNSTIKLV